MLAIGKPLPSSASLRGRRYRGSSEIGRGKSIGLTEGILLPAEAVQIDHASMTLDLSLTQVIVILSLQVMASILLFIIYISKE